MIKLKTLTLLAFVVFLAGCGMSHEEALNGIQCASYEFSNPGRDWLWRSHKNCTNIMEHCAWQCDRAIDDYRDSNAENEQVNVCLDKCIWMYKE
jgi:hypothetical protein